MLATRRLLSVQTSNRHFCGPSWGEAFDLVEIKQSAIRKQGKSDVGLSPRYDHIGGYGDGSSRSVSPS